MTRRPPVDWFRLLRDLRYDANQSLASVARRIQVKFSTVKNWWLEHNEPGHSNGEALCDFYRDALGREPPRRGLRVERPKTDGNGA